MRAPAPVIPLILALGSLSLWSCATSAYRPADTAAVTAKAANPVAENEAKVETDTRTAYKAGGADGARALVDGYLKDLRYPSAYVAIQVLRELEGDSGQDLKRLGDACWGLGAFQEAASAYYAALQGGAECQGCYWDIAYIMVAMGEWANAQEFLKGPVKNGDGLPWLRLYEQTLRNPAQRAQAAQDYAAANPKDPAATEHANYVASLGAHGGPGTIIAGEGEVITTRLTDSYDVFVEINGFRTRLNLDTGASGIIISSNAAKKAGVKKGQQQTIYGIGSLEGSGGSDVYIGHAQTVKMGNLTLADVPLRITTMIGGAGTGSDGIIGPDVLPGWAYLMDRKKEVLSFYPPGTPLPDLGPKAMSQPFLQFGHSILTDVGVVNRIRDNRWEVNMIIDTGAFATFYNLDYAERLDFGDLQSTNTVRIAGLAGTTRTVQVNNSEIHLGGANFMFKSFYALNGMDTWRPMPYGLVGRDILSRFRILVVPWERRIVFDLYKA